MRGEMGRAGEARENVSDSANRADFSAAVDERLACSPPIKANRVQSPAGSLPDFRKWESCVGLPRWLASFFGDIPLTPSLHSGAEQFSPHFTLISCQDLVTRTEPEEVFPHTIDTPPLPNHTPTYIAGTSTHITVET
ncbi:hypothetical protein PR048_022601 [Dryococelus australis]|uniref:Uncharacterized protein n=1 Tax=Dryococelus australis TaxID=614101 RepID=A0ABQ9H1I8_9NEOP|nr:hypothetical protein PR048_022601 [Dryococelus australis]